jgi:hypothetical protein
LTVSGKTDDTEEEEPDTPTLTAKAVLDFERKADMLADMDPTMERKTVKKKGKAVPLHTIEALGGRNIAPTHSRPRH